MVSENLRERRKEILGSAAIIRDVSERWRHEKELKGRLKLFEEKLESQKSVSALVVISWILIIILRIEPT